MLSKLERVLLRSNRNNQAVRTLLFDLLDDGTSLHRLRQTSRVLRDLVSHESHRLFHTLFVHASARHAIETSSLHSIGPFCKSLTLKIPLCPSEISQATLHPMNRNKIPPGPHTPNPLSPLFLLLPNLSTLTLHTPPVFPTWPPYRHEVEHLLLALRSSLEHVAPSSLRTLHLTPLPARGILHLSWSSFTALGSAPPLWKTPEHPTNVWQRLRTLHLYLENPFPALTAEQGRMLERALRGYLRSLAGTLEELRFVWVGKAGGDPIGERELGWEKEKGKRREREVGWTKLRVLEIGNCEGWREFLRGIAGRAPGLERVGVLYVSNEGSGVETWIDVPVRLVRGEGEGREERKRVSASSGFVPIYLDVESMHL